MKEKIAVIIGYGSIGKLHEKVIKKINFFNKIYILTKQKISKDKKIKSINEIINLNPDYIIISSTTDLHYKHLKYLNNKLSNCKILIEKPLFHKKINFPKLKNKIFVGYDMRFHPIINKIKSLIQNKTIWNIHIFCGSYLPNWRKNIDYRNSYSSKKNKGGGVLLDLSHELDYLLWIFGSINPKYVISKKISNLNITSDDTFILLGNIKKTKLNLSLNYFTRKPIRQIIIDGNNISITADLIENIIFYTINNKNYKKSYKKIKRGLTTKYMHHSILNHKGKNASNFKDGLKVLNLIESSLKLI